MIAAIDSGNTSVKLGIFNEGNLLNVFNSVSILEIPGILRRFPVNKVIISDVGGNKSHLISGIPDGIPVLTVKYDLRFPFNIKYKTPATLGSDRISAVAGAWDKYQPADILVIDAGTCITYDFIDKGGNYWGGGISPGINLRLKSLHDFTASLPEVNMNDDYELIGSDTISSIQSGTIGGIVSEIKGMMERYLQYYPDLKIVMSGGSSRFFESKIKGTIFVNPELVLWGLRVIAEYNEI